MSNDLPPELQADQDRFYAELMGNPNEAIWVTQWHGSTTAMEGRSRSTDGEVGIRSALLRVDGTIGPHGPPIHAVLVIHSDIAGSIADRLRRAAGPDFDKPVRRVKEEDQ